MGMMDWEMNQAVVEVAQECPNVYLIGSATNDKAVLYAVRQLGADRVLFGTDAPFQRPHVVRAWYEALLQYEVSEAEMAQVMGGNAARLFAL
jgi:predicted TIM-barrel fold metal-dependent hydrolase